MKQLNQFEENVKLSFMYVKGDIEEIKRLIGYQQHQIELLKAEIENIKKNQNNENRIVVENISLSTKNVDLSKAESEIIDLLSNSRKGMTYKELAVVLNKSPNTIKNHINSIKKKQYALIEKTDGDGKKIFSLPNNAYANE